MVSDEPHHSAVHSPYHIAAPIARGGRGACMRGKGGLMP